MSTWHVTLENIVLEIVNDYKLIGKRSIFEKMNSDMVPDFPKLTWTILYLICLGTYQIKQAISYYAEHINENGKYKLQVCRENDSIDFNKYGLRLKNPLLLKIQLKSRQSPTQLPGI